jgi:16S rRNA (guanine527-N7)-methyltransferase
MSAFEETLRAALGEAGIPHDDALIARCRAYFDIVVKVNEQLNLTRITDEEQAARQHFADAMIVTKYLDLPPDCRVIDVGTGAGFPGVPLKLLRPDIDMTLLDASGKKTDFVRSALESLGVFAQVVCGRAEELARTEMRERFDVVLSRAVAGLPMLLELCVPLLRTGGTMTTWKGESAEQELAEAQHALAVLGCVQAGAYPVGLGALLLFTKQKPAPEKYPRRFAKIKSDPL